MSLLAKTPLGSLALWLWLAIRVAHAQPQEPPPAAGQVTRMPELLQAVAPEYPEAALRAGKQAVVTVRIHIDATGTVTNVEVPSPIGDGFDEAAIAAAEQYVFAPAEIDGAPGAIVVETAIHFVIEQGPAEAPPADATPATPTAEAVPGHAGNPLAPVSIAGEAREQGTRRRLAGIIVSLAELGLDAITDEKGRFFFHGVAPGQYQLVAFDPRYQRFERGVALLTDEAIDVRLWLRPRGGSPYETVVEGEREPLEVTRRTLQRRQLVSVPGTFGDPIRAIQTLPGLARSPFGLGFLVVRGSNPDDTGVFIDGHQVPLLFHFLGGPSILSPDLVENLELYPGGFPARFGRFHGGIVSIETRPAASGGVHGSADVDFFDAGGYLRAPLSDEVAVSLSGRRSYIDAFLGAVLPEPDPGSTRVVVPVYYDWQARVDWNGKRRGTLSVFALASSDRLDVLSTDADQEQSLNLNSAIGFWRVIATYKRPLWGDLSFSASPAFGRARVSFAGAQADAAGPYTSLGVTQHTASYRMRVYGRASSRVLLDTGIDLESRVSTYQAQIPLDEDIRGGDDIDIPPEAVQRGAEQIGLALHADVALDITPKLRLIPGLRADGYLLNGHFRGSFDPRLVARYAVTGTITAKSYLGLFHQPPQPEALDERFGNPQLRLERGLHAGLGGEWRPSRLWLVDAEIYGIDRRNLVTFTRDAELGGDGTVTPTNFVNSGHRWSYGLEVLARREITDDFYGWLSYTLSVSRQQQRETSAVVPTVFDQTHNLNLVGSWKPGKGWELGARLRLTTGRPTTPIIGATYDADSGGYNGVNGEARSERAPLYHQFDVRAEKTWLFRTWMLGLYLDVQNLYNAENVEAIEYDYRFREQAPVSGIPILPTLGIRGQW